MDRLCLTGGFICDSGCVEAGSWWDQLLEFQHFNWAALCSMGRREGFVLIKRKKGPSEVKADGLLDDSDISHVKTIN